MAEWPEVMITPKPSVFEPLDIVYTPQSYYGVIFAERALAKRVARIARAVNESKTWGEFRTAMPADDWEEVVVQRDVIPADDIPFSPEAFGWGEDGWFTGPWPPQEALVWFPKDLIEKYGGRADTAGPNYDHLFLPGDAADAIAAELRARGHRVEETLTGDLADWLSYFYDDPAVPQSVTTSPSSSTRRPIFIISTEGKSKEQMKAEARKAYLKYVGASRKIRDQES
jgi:hypothetical protein